MILWRPSQNNQRYAFTPLLDREEDYSSDEDVLYTDAWDGMKKRGEKTERPDTPDGEYVVCGGMLLLQFLDKIYKSLKYFVRNICRS